MKKLLAVVMAVACATAFATDYTWTGEGAAGSWKDPANWGGGGYPHLRGDTATVAVDADITVDETVTITALNATSGAKVTVRDDGSAELHFMPFILTTGTKVTCGPNATGTGTELTLLAKVVNDKDSEAGGYNRSDPGVSGGGVLRFGGTWTNGTMTGTIYLGGNAGTFDFSNCDFHAVQDMNFGWESSSGNMSKTVNMTLGSGAAVSVTRTFLMGGNSRTPNTYVVQEEGSTFEPLYFDMGTATSNGGPGYIDGWNTTNTFVKKGGLLTTSALTLGKYLSGFFLQDGGTSICTVVEFPVVPNAYSRLIVTGGTFGFIKLKANAGFPDSPTPLANPDNVEISFSDCTVLNSGAYENQIGHPVLLDGDLTFDSTQGKATGFTNPVIGDRFNPTMTENAKVDLTMTRDFEQTAGSPVYRNLQVASGCTYTLSGGRLTVTGDIAPADTSAAIDLKGGTLAFPASMSPSGVVRVSGDVNIEVAAGKTVNLCVEMSATGSITETGAGTLNVTYGGNSVLASGTYAFGTLTVGEKGPTVLTIDGADVTVTTLSFGSKSAPLGDGKVVLKSGSLSIGTFDDKTFQRGSVELQGGELVVTGNLTVNDDIIISGSAAIDIASGKTLTFTRPPTFRSDVTLVKRGAGTLAFAADSTTLWRGDFDIEEGIVQLLKWATLKHDPAAESPTHTIAIRDKGRFIIGEKYNLAQVAAWVDYVITDGGCIVGHERNTIPVNSVTVDGVAQAVGAYSGTGYTRDKNDYESVTGWFRQDGGTYNSAIVIPYRWTGAGDGVTWENEDNWKDGTKPCAVDAAKNIYSFADLSAAEHITFANAITITGFIYMPTAGEGRLVVEGLNGKQLAFRSTGYGIGPVVSQGCELVLRNCQLSRGGGGTPIFRAVGGQVTFDGNYNFNQAVMSGYPYFGTGMAVTHATNSAPSQTYYFGAYAGQYSYWWFDEGTSLTFSRLYTGVSSVPSVPVLGVRNGGDLTLTDLYISRISGDNIPQFFLEGAESKVTLTEGLYLGTRCPSTSTIKVDSGGAFIQTAGTLTTPKIANELDNNYFYLRGGELYLGEGGLVVSTSRKDNPIYDPKTGQVADSTIYQTTPAFYFQGGALHATAGFTDALVTEVSDDTTSVLDTDEYTVTLAGDLVGKGVLVKTGTGALVLDGALKGAASLRIEEGSLRLGESYTETEHLAQLIAPSTDAIDLANGQNLTVGAFIVDGVARTGTVTCGAGTVTVTGAVDWLTEAILTETYVKTFTESAELGSISYENLVTDAGHLTITGGQDVTLTLSAGAVIRVAAGDALVFDLPVHFAGAVTITGGGDVKFLKTTTSAASQITYLKGGTYLTVAAQWTQNGSICFRGSDTDARLCRLTVEGSGSVNQDPFPMNGTTSANGEGIGGEMVLKDGGTFRLRNTAGVFGTSIKQTQRIIMENGGILNIPGYLKRNPAADASTLEILDYGGVLRNEEYGVGPILTRDITVELHGQEMEIRPCDTKGLNVVAANFTGIGAIVQKKSGKVLYLNGDLSAVTNLSVKAGGLVLQDTAVDTLSQSDVSLNRAAATLSIAGTATIDGLYLDGVQARQGLYGKGIAPKAKFLAPIESGFLDVKDGLPPGGMILIR